MLLPVRVIALPDPGALPSDRRGLEGRRASRWTVPVAAVAGLGVWIWQGLPGGPIGAAAVTIGAMLAGLLFAFWVLPLFGRATDWRANQLRAGESWLEILGPTVRLHRADRPCWDLTEMSVSDERVRFDIRLPGIALEVARDRVPSKDVLWLEARAGTRHGPPSPWPQTT